MNRRATFSLVLALSAIILSVVAFQNLQPERQFSYALGQLEKCTRKGENTILCARPLVKKLLETKNASEIIDGLSPRLPAVQCHFIGHVIGQETFSTLRDVEAAMAQCNGECTSACSHGVIGEAFARQLGLGSPEDAQEVDLEHLNPEDIRVIGRDLCTTVQTCHGVGHSLFQMYKQFRPALDLCKEIASSTASGCYSGTFMEYADVLIAKNMRAQADVKYPDVGKINTFCTDGFSLVEMRSCFAYFPRIVQAGLAISPEKTLVKVEEICASLSGSERAGCYSGIGVNNGHMSDTDLKAASEFCDRYQNADKAACIFGMVVIATENRLPVLFPYCASFSDDEERYICYQGVFNRIEFQGVSISEAADTYCGTDPICRKGERDLTLDTWQLIDDFAQRSR